MALIFLHCCNQFLFLISDHESTYMHALEALRNICGEPLQHEWYLIVKDAVYVNVDRVKEVLLRMSADDNVVLGEFQP